MSRSIHVAGKNFKGLTKEDIDGQATDPDSDQAQWSKKNSLKKEVKKKRKKK